ncbi:MAG TPA: DUF6519 domain-containing protein [Dyella sp.]|uniref:DUF6519 domain-containing protein n=1 Tax=Dyella sp. TaxID=1869338 RepID=UPI002D77CE11|nr:DUF6519 domain-containing protein [Dyella sp.]HET6553499.1 DUF6519 domain-containing protein [Dyella sp.]
MKGDFARVTFDSTLHYSQVYQQQGRVTLEADWNEQASIQLSLLRTLAMDLVGPCWAAGNGFLLAAAPKLPDWSLTPGHFYVDGILCVNESACTFGTQPYLPTPDTVSGNDGSTGQPAGFVLYLDVWERHLCALEAPGIADVALNGVDTASRAQVIWQMRMLDLNPEQSTASLANVRTALGLRKDLDAATLKQDLANLDALANALNGQGPANTTLCDALRQLVGVRATYAWPRMRAQLGPVDTDSDPCVIAADARYRGCENQLYRVEIHRGGLGSTDAAPSTTSFKWSRENGSVVFPALSSVLGRADDGSAIMTVTLGSLGHDQRLGLAIGDWVELVDDDYSLAQLAYSLLQVRSLDSTRRTVQLSVVGGATPYALSNDPRKHPLLRRWDQRDDVTAGGDVVLVEGDSITLENGVQVRFEPGGLYATGDYWLIPARVSGQGLIEWPQVGGTPAPLPSRGMHHAAVLGSFTAGAGYTECCCRFDSLCTLLRNSATHKLLVAPTGAVAKQAVVAKAVPAVKKAAPAAKKAASVVKKATRKKG